jgi:hypothetical protein
MEDYLCQQKTRKHTVTTLHSSSRAKKEEVRKGAAARNGIQGQEGIKRMFPQKLTLEIRTRRGLTA